MRNIKKIDHYDLEITLKTKCNEKIRFYIYNLNKYGLQRVNKLTDSEVITEYTDSIHFVIDKTFKFYFKLNDDCYVDGDFTIKDAKNNSEIFDFLIKTLGTKFCSKYNLTLSTYEIKMDPIGDYDDIHYFLISMADQN